jgi:hypothetical protein
MVRASSSISCGLSFFFFTPRVGGGLDSVDGARTRGLPDDLDGHQDTGAFSGAVRTEQSETAAW